MKTIFPKPMRLDERGTVLLMALIIMSGAVISAMGLGTLIISSLQQVRALDDGMMAYYAAESGVEESVYSARKRDVTPASTTAYTSLSNNARWTRTVSKTESVLYVGTLNQDAVTEVVLYDPDASTTATGISSVRVQWTDGCSGCSVAEVSLVGWTTGGSVLWDPNAEVYQYPWNAGGVLLSLPDPTKAYRLRITAKTATMQNIQVRAYDGSGVSKDIPGRVVINAVGRFGVASQRLTATLPRQAQLSGIFDFVIFTECSLVKGGASSSCP